MASTGIDRALKNLEARIAETDAAAKALRQAFEADDDWQSTLARWTRLLTSVEDAGGWVPVDEWKRLARAAGYADPRSLGGFFKGANASMRSDGERRILTDAGRAFVESQRRPS